MRFFIRSALIYFLVATTLNLALRDDAAVIGLKFLGLSIYTFNVFGIAFPITAAVILGAWRTSRSTGAFVQRMSQCVLTLILCYLFLAGFSSVKTLLPLIAETTGQTHFGMAPWQLAHAVAVAALSLCHEHWIPGLDNWALLAAGLFVSVWTRYRCSSDTIASKIVVVASRGALASGRARDSEAMSLENPLARLH